MCIGFLIRNINVFNSHLLWIRWCQHLSHFWAITSFYVDDVTSVFHETSSKCFIRLNYHVTVTRKAALDNGARYRAEAGAPGTDQFVPTQHSTKKRQVTYFFVFRLKNIQATSTRERTLNMVLQIYMTTGQTSQTLGHHSFENSTIFETASWHDFLRNVSLWSPVRCLLATKEQSMGRSRRYTAIHCMVMTPLFLLRYECWWAALGCSAMPRQPVVRVR